MVLEGDIRMLDLKPYKDQKEIKIIIGAGNQKYKGWIDTGKESLDLTKEKDWLVTFNDRKADVFLCEHVWEHLTLEEGENAAKYVYNSLNPGGYIRVSVPDKYFQNEEYQNMVKIGGPGPEGHPAFDHKIVYDYKLLSRVFEQAGFVVKLLEYCDENGKFHYKDWDNEKGFIYRTFKNDHRNSKNQFNFLSLLIDAIKPL